jgi:hypothetical protein
MQKLFKIHRKNFFLVIFIVIGMFFSAGIVNADRAYCGVNASGARYSCFRVPVNMGDKINRFNACRIVKNRSNTQANDFNKEVFVPTKTEQEWTLFRRSAGDGNGAAYLAENNVTLGPCPDSTDSHDFEEGGGCTYGAASCGSASDPNGGPDGKCIVRCP